MLARNTPLPTPSRLGPRPGLGLGGDVGEADLELERPNLAPLPTIVSVSGVDGQCPLRDLAGGRGHRPSWVDCRHSPILCRSARSRRKSYSVTARLKTLLCSRRRRSQGRPNARARSHRSSGLRPATTATGKRCKIRSPCAMVKAVDIMFAQLGEDPSGALARRLRARFCSRRARIAVAQGPQIIAAKPLESDYVG